MLRNVLSASALAVGAAAQLQDLPSGYNESQWALVTNENPLLAVLPGHFNRTVFDAPSEANVTDSRIADINDKLNATSFAAYDERFFDIIGPDATIEQIQTLPFQVHEAACFIPEQSKLFFVQWGPPGGEDGTHDYQYMLDTKTNKLEEVKTNPPSVNVHGAVYYKGSIYAVTDGSTHGSNNETGYLAKIDPETLERTTLLNNFHERPFIGFNDIEMDEEGNFYLTDSRSGYGRDLVSFAPPTIPTVYFVNGTNLRIKEVLLLEGNANGIAISPDSQTLYVGDTGASETKPVARHNPYGPREMWALDFAKSSAGARVPLLQNRRMLSNALEHFYDGIRVTKNGWIFAGAGEGVDVLDPESGLTMGTIRLGGGSNAAVTLAFGEEGVIYIVGKGGIWKVSNVKEPLRRAW